MDMDHGHHNGMDHGGHNGTGNGGMDMSMSMIWNWDTKNIKLIFPFYHITTEIQFFFTLILLFLVAFFYEYLSLLRYRLDNRYMAHLLKQEERAPLLHDTSPSDSTDNMPSSHVGIDVNSQGSRSSSVDRNLPSFHHAMPNGNIGKLSMAKLNAQQKLARAFLFGVQNFISMLIMLVFMTYNGYFIFITIFGAAAGFYFFECQRSEKSYAKEDSCCR
ncbi:Ctr copper transporter family-domain-containing protein [Paraphysoderma sedebokerense]|nr:Ctr copper transporter family-domain-containing protein [Paraphysoderma sedebokerense]